MIKLNGNHLGFTVYPNNETVLLDIILPHIDYDDHNVITMNYLSDLDLTRMMMVKMWIDDLTDVECFLEMAYVPYSRMDRSEEDSAFSLKYLCTFINNLNFDKVFISEAHSYMTVALLNNVIHYRDSSVEIAMYAMNDAEFSRGDYVLFPDAGALKRYSADWIEDGIDVLVGEKDRDFQTGEILQFLIRGSQNLGGRKVLIIDDLCSMGGSFYYAGKRLKEMGAGNIFLAVTHCEDTIHKGKLLKGDEIKHIFTTDSLLTIPHRKITLVIN